MFVVFVVFVLVCPHLLFFLGFLDEGLQASRNAGHKAEELKLFVKVLLALALKVVDQRLNDLLEHRLQRVLFGAFSVEVHVGPHVPNKLVGKELR